MRDGIATAPDSFDVAVIGSGFGGLAAALTLAERGGRVVVFETLGYPGGCAGTFERKGYRFDAGATLLSGFGDGELMRRWVDRHQLDVQVTTPEPMLELRAPGLRLPIATSRRQLMESFCTLPGAPVAALRRFFELQRKVAEVLWEPFADPRLLPPLTPSTVLGHLRRMPRYLPLARLLGRPLTTVLRRYGLEDFAPLRLYLDAVCQITVQCSAAEAEAPFALGAMDFYHRGTGHVAGGVGRLAEGLVSAIRRCGGEVRYFDRVTALRRDRDSWQAKSRRGEVTARTVVANLLPAALAYLLDEPVPSRLRRLQKQVESGWGAAMLYLGLDPGRLERPDPFHLELVDNPEAPLIEGNHLFCSVSGADEAGRGPNNERTATVSTHIRMDRLRAFDRAGQAEYVASIQHRMDEVLARWAPELAEAVTMRMPASPRTFERFTGRPGGFVGGIPRRAGLNNYRSLASRPVLPGLYLVGDSVFPGQSTLAVAVGGQRTAAAVATCLGVRLDSDRDTRRDSASSVETVPLLDT